VPRAGARDVGSASLLCSPCYWPVLLMRRLALVAEGSSRGGSSLRTEVLLSRAATTACCQLQVNPILISLSSFPVVLCSSSENRSCVCLPALSCIQYPTISSNTATAPSFPLHDSKAWRTISLCVLSGCSASPRFSSSFFVAALQVWRLTWRSSTCRPW
jgi:hypothetical protein